MFEICQAIKKTQSNSFARPLAICLKNNQLILENTNPSAFSAERDIFEKWTINHKLAGFAYESYFLDIGIPADFLKAQHEFQKLKY